nr:reverse transcriptase domain-containing protein [Tanacetum cinerariifolium]
MTDNRTMAEMLRAPIEGYAEAIVVPPILAEQFDLKHSLINMMTSEQLFGLEKDNLNDHIRWFIKITSTIKYKDVPNSVIKLILFPFSLAGAARQWLEKEPPHSITTWDDLVSKFINEFFPPLRTTNYRNEILNFQQKFDESFHKAWERYKDLLRACPHQNFTKLHQLDTFYNALNPADQDSLNAAAGGNLLEKSPQDALTIIKNKSKGNLGYRPQGVANQMRPPGIAQPNVQNNQNRFGQPQGFNRRTKFNQEQPYQATAQSNQNFHLNELEKIKRMNDVSLKAMQNQIDMVKNDLRNEMKTSNQTSLSNQTNEIKNMTASLLQMNTTSTSGSRSLPGNTIANPKGELKAIAIRSGIVTDGPTVPTPPKSITLEEDECVKETYTDPDLAEYTIKVPPPPEKLQELANTPLNENCSAVILKKLPEKLGDPGKFLIPCGFSLHDLILTRMTLELANCAIRTRDGITSDVFVPVGKFTFLADFVIDDYESDPRVPLILGRPFLRTARALIDVHGEEIILHDGDERLTLNMKHDTTSYSNHPHRESVNVINIFNISSEDCLQEFTDELALITYPLDYDDNLKCDIEFDLKEIEFLLYQGEDSNLKDSIDQTDLANLDDYFVNPTPEMFTDKHAPDYSFSPRFDMYPDDLLEIKSDADNFYDDPFDSKGEKIKESELLIGFSRDDDLPSPDNEDKVFNPGILIQEKSVKIITRVAQEKKLAISYASLVFEDFDPPFYELLIFNDVPNSMRLLSLSSKNEEKVFKPGIYTSEKAPMEGYGKAIVIPKILAEKIEIKEFTSRMTATLKYRDVLNDAIKLMLFSYSLEGVARVWFVIREANRMFLDKLADLITNLVEIVNKQVIAPAKAVEKTYVTCGGAHAYYECIATDSNPSSICAKTGSYNQVSPPNRASHQIPPPGFALVQNNPNRFNQNQGSFFHNQPLISGTLLSNTVPNPKGEIKVVTTRSGLAYEGPSIPTSSPLEKVDEQNTVEIFDKEHSNSSGSTAQVQPPVVPILIPEPDVSRTQTKPSIPYPFSFADALFLMPKFASTIKSLLANKDKLFELAKVSLNENCSAMLLKKLPEKLGNPSKFLIPCDFPGMEVCHALADLRASINLIPLSIQKKLSLLELTPTRMTLELADRWITHPKGVAEDVFVKVGKFHFPTDFVVVDFEADPRVSIILGRYFLRIGHVLIDVYGEEITLRVNDESITFNLNQTMRYSLTYDDTSVNRVDVIDIACEDFVQDVLDFQYNPKSSILTLVFDDFISESDACKEPIVKSALPTLSPFGENPFQLHSIDLKLAEESKEKSFVEEPPELELKELPSHLGFYTHKILMEDDYKPAVQSQRRVDPKIHDVIKKEVIKLLDAGMIYTISNSPWVSLIHCVPKKGGMTVVANENNELIPTRLVTGWRVCIDYRKLNDATGKYHFPLPFMDQMLERLAGNEFYCFLDGIPRAIISDRGTHLCNDQFTRVMIKYGVTHRLATAYHPQTSGQVDISNRCTPYKLVYGKSCHLLIKLEHMAYWALKHASFYVKIAGDHHKLQLNELSELRDQGYENSVIYKERAKKLHDSKIKNRIFNVGDQVLLFNSRLKIFSEKLKTRWSGPFTITRVFPYGTIEYLNLMV